MHNNKTFIITVLFLFLTTNITFAQHRDRDEYTDQDSGEHKGNREGHRGKGKGPNPAKFTFWFSQKSSGKQRHMQLFDQHAIFDFDTEIASALTDTRDLQDSFRKDKILLDVQIEYLERELVKLIQEHQINRNKSQEILETYTALFDLCTQSYSLMDNHTTKMKEIFQETYKNYNTKIQQKITTATKDPEILTEELIKRYESVSR